MELKIKGYRVRRYEPEYHNSDDWDFVSVKKRLESLGYTATIYKRTSLSASYVFNKANSVFLTLKDGDDIIGEFEMHDLILNYTGKQRLTEQQIVIFCNDVNSGKISLVKSGKSFYIK